MFLGSDGNALVSIALHGAPQPPTSNMTICAAVVDSSVLISSGLLSGINLGNPPAMPLKSLLGHLLFHLIFFLCGR